MAMKPRRRGPGRPPFDGELKQVRLYVTPEQIDKLDAVAAELNGNRSAAARLILDKLPVRPVKKAETEPWLAMF